MIFDDIVSDYIREYRDDARAEMRFFEIQRSPSVAIHKAALCVLGVLRLLEASAKNTE
jgi:hypothetical protein